MILDSSSIMLIMVPICAPIAKELGFDLVHFGIITVVAVEMGLLSPPFGISVFTVKATLNDPNVSIETIFAGSMPYFGIMGVVLIALVFIPWMSVALVN
jgi:C4-dicarboxylate transporter, DctM subunit